MDYRDKIIEELKETNDKLININEKQIDVNMKFAAVTEKNNEGYQKTIKLLIICSIISIVFVCISAMVLIHIADSKINNSTNINNNTNTNKNNK